MRDAQFKPLTRSEHMAFEIRSPAFSDGGKIPRQYTCEGPDDSPPLEWSGAPQGTRSLALIVDDPDAPDPAKPQRVYVHWVVYDIPADSNGFGDKASSKGLPAGASVGNNDWGKAEWGGPCPPIGRHRYFFKLYALDTSLEKLSSPTKKDLESAMEGHILAQAVVMGTYQKGD
jgi:Raf kinase inhibitor-like YbhB/YbcL family protein